MFMYKQTPLNSFLYINMMMDGHEYVMNTYIHTYMNNTYIHE